MLVPSCILLICGGKCLIVRSKQIWDKEASLSPGPASQPRSDLRPALVTIITPPPGSCVTTTREHGYKYNLLIWHFLYNLISILWRWLDLYCIVAGFLVEVILNFDKCWQENKPHWECSSVICVFTVATAFFIFQLFSPSLPLFSHLVH